MILEVAILNVKTAQEAGFEAAFIRASSIIASMKGYRRHELRRCLEVANQYVLLVEWDTLEDHTISFRGSDQYQEWRRLLHHFYDPFPTVEHYEAID
ncbi:MAG: antibiotic biosynthesis monooxygenase [Anaerolineaceae bacterium]|nr:antibiotic biosynthesis monooxygenase [Anaerolineaceae bacterium]